MEANKLNIKNFAKKLFSTGKSVAILDDSPGFAKILKYIYEDQKHFAKYYKYSEDLDNFYNEVHGYDIALIDWKLGRESGAHVAKRVMNHRQVKPEVFIYSSMDQRFCREHGFICKEDLAGSPMIIFGMQEDTLKLATETVALTRFDTYYKDRMAQ